MICNLTYHYLMSNKVSTFTTRCLKYVDKIDSDICDLIREVSCIPAQNNNTEQDEMKTTVLQNNTRHCIKYIFC